MPFITKEDIKEILEKTTQIKVAKNNAIWNAVAYKIHDNKNIKTAEDLISEITEANFLLTDYPLKSEQIPYPIETKINDLTINHEDRSRILDQISKIIKPSTKITPQDSQGLENKNSIPAIT
jgi:hypothetical protein